MLFDDRPGREGKVDASSKPPLRIDIVSDVVCPWCVIGWRQLERALAAIGITADVHWHPFELNPGLGPEGEDLAEHIARKYGTTPEASRASRARIAALGADLGFTFAYANGSRVRNTFLAHQPVHWAGTQGREHAAERALFAAYFTRGEDVHDLEVLAAVAGEIGLDADEARRVLADGRFAEAVREEEALWTGRGIQGVPAMIFAERYLVSGAQGVENYTAILGRLVPVPAA
jgi:predicted DsbA family dithiol-disulfide isomerase